MFPTEKSVSSAKSDKSVAASMLTCSSSFFLLLSTPVLPSASSSGKEFDWNWPFVNTVCQQVGETESLSWKLKLLCWRTSFFFFFLNNKNFLLLTVAAVSLRKPCVWYWDQIFFICANHTNSGFPLLSCQDETCSSFKLVSQDSNTHPSRLF